MTSRELPQADGDAATSRARLGDEVSRDLSGRSGRTDEPDRQPNYLIRRGIAIGGVVAAIAAGAVVVGSLLERDGEDPSTGAADAEWNTIVLVDERSGQVILGDETGEEETRFASGVTSATDALVVGPTLVVTATDGAAVVDLSDESNEIVDIDLGASGVTMPAGSALTMLTTTALGERALLVHGPSGELLDTDTYAPIAGARYDVTTAVASPSGRDVLITDSGNFQTVLFSFDRDEPSYFPGRALAVSEDVVVTTQNVGNEASITVFDHDGESLTDARAPSVRAGMVAGDAIILAAVDGEIIELAMPSGATSELDALDVGTVQTGHVDPGGTRLIVTGDAGTAVVDETGAVLGTFAGGAPLDTGIDELASRTSSCVTVVIASDNGLVIAALDDGSVIAEATGVPPTLSSVDGCTVVTTTVDGLTVVSADGASDRVADGALVALSPDGQWAVTASAAGRLLLTDLTSNPSSDEVVASVPGTDATRDGAEERATDAIDLGPASRFVLFTQR